jgi:hypothetical protein
MSSWEKDMQDAAEAHIEQVWDYWNRTMDDAVDDAEEDPAIGPFDGCTTCEVREILTVAVPILARALQAGEVTVEDLLA